MKEYDPEEKNLFIVHHQIEYMKCVEAFEK